MPPAKASYSVVIYEIKRKIKTNKRVRRGYEIRKATKSYESTSLTSQNSPFRNPYIRIIRNSFPPPFPFRNFRDSRTFPSTFIHKHIYQTDPDPNHQYHTNTASTEMDERRHFPFRSIA